MDSAQRAHGETVVLTGIEQTWRSGRSGRFLSVSRAGEEVCSTLVETQTTPMPARHP